MNINKRNKISFLSCIWDMNMQLVHDQIYLNLHQWYISGRGTIKNETKTFFKRTVLKIAKLASHFSVKSQTPPFPNIYNAYAA